MYRPPWCISCCLSLILTYIGIPTHTQTQAAGGETSELPSFPHSSSTPNKLARLHRYALPFYPQPPSDQCVFSFYPSFSSFPAPARMLPLSSARPRSRKPHLPSSPSPTTPPPSHLPSPTTKRRLPYISPVLSLLRFQPARINPFSPPSPARTALDPWAATPRMTPSSIAGTTKCAGVYASTIPTTYEEVAG